MATVHGRSLRLTRVWCAVVIAAVAYAGLAVPLVASAVVVDAAQAPPSPGSAPSKQCSAPYFEFWTGESGAPTDVIPHANVPAIVGDGFTLDAGFLGENQFASLSFQDTVDGYTPKYRDGQVDPTTGLPTSTSGGYTVSTAPFYDDFSDGLSPSNFVVLTQKDSTPDNVDIVQDTVGDTVKNVVRLTAVAGTDSGGNPNVASTGVIESANLYTSGEFEVVARFPAVMGVVSSVWLFHFELHLEEYAKEDPQFLPNLNVGGKTLTNHEIDMEVPASCPGMCPGGGCPGQFDTMNLNAYRYTNSDGEGPAYANLCVQAPLGTQFVDNSYHKYTVEWHTGDGTDSCKPHINFYFDDQYIGSVNVFVPTRGVRLVAGIWGGDSNWVGYPLWEEAYAYISSVKVTPFDESRSTNYPQVYDEPSNHPTFVEKSIPPPAFPALRTGQRVVQPAFKAAPQHKSSLVVVVLVTAGIAVLVALVLVVVIAMARHQRQRGRRDSDSTDQMSSSSGNALGALMRSRLSTVAEVPGAESEGDTLTSERSSLLVSVVGTDRTAAASPPHQRRTWATR